MKQTAASAPPTKGKMLARAARVVARRTFATGEFLGPAPLAGHLAWALNCGGCIARRWYLPACQQGAFPGVVSLAKTQFEHLLL